MNLKRTLQQIRKAGNLREWGFPFFKPVRVRLGVRPAQPAGKFSSRRPGAWSLRIDLGTGAGHRWGRTLFIGHNVKGGEGLNMYVPRKLVVLFTRNANLVPYTVRKDD